MFLIRLLFFLFGLILSHKNIMNKIKILVTTDNHLGYKEDDPILKLESFENFENSLNIGLE